MEHESVDEICTSGVHLRMCAGPNANECSVCETCTRCTKQIKKECFEAHFKRCTEDYELETSLMYVRLSEPCDNYRVHDNNCGWGRPDCMKCVACEKCDKNIVRYLVEQHATITCEKSSRDEVKKNIAKRKAKVAQNENG